MSEEHPFFLYRKIVAEADWQTDEKNLPKSVSHWLLHTDSLTQKLQTICQQLRVKIITEQWLQAGAFTQKFANFVAEPTACWQREVLLKCGEKDLLFAQTTLPEITVERVAQAILNLGEQPIGLWLFPQNPQRVRLEWSQDIQTGLYARRSIFLLHGYPLEISEVFLKEFIFIDR